jgi:transcriptional regulator with XRE-family HTH domain
MSKATPMPRLERWITENRVTYAALAESLGVTEAAIFHYVKGRNRPNAQNLVRLSEITGITCGELLSSDHGLRLECVLYPLV